MFWGFCRAAWESADVMPDLRIQRGKLKMGWYVKAPNELVAACCEGLLMVSHDIRRFNACEHCGAFFWLEHVKPRRRIERICPECREESKTRRREYDRRRKRIITPTARFFNTVNQAKRRGRIGPEEVEMLKRICREKGVEAAREEYERRKLKGSG